MNVTVDLGGVSYRATLPTVPEALALVQAVHDALTGLGMEAWVQLPAGVYGRDEWGARRVPERRAR